MCASQEIQQVASGSQITQEAEEPGRCVGALVCGEETKSWALFLF